MSPRVDILYLAWNRLEFTRETFLLLLRNTDWTLARRLIVYDDGSTDGTREWLDESLGACPVPAELVFLGFGSPVKTMLHYLAADPAPLFAKIDNDIAVPPHWLNTLVDVMGANPDLELLGMEAGQTALPMAEDEGEPYTVTPCSWIGGVGLMRSQAFLSRPPMEPIGRFGFTRWQQDHEPVRGWITPDLLVPQLDRIPDEPYAALSERYIRSGWQRVWPLMDDTWCRPYYDWLPR